MDFDAIESLNEEELNSLYEEYNSDMDGVLMGWCGCRRADGGLVFVGSQVVGGHCLRMQEEGLYSEGACRVWCRSRGFTWLGYGTVCYCYRYREEMGTYGWIDRCPSE